MRNNVIDIAEIFTDPWFWGLPGESCQLLVDPPEPTTIASALICAAETTTDTLVVYLSGHGMVSREGELIIATQNTEAHWPEFTGLRYSWVREALRHSAAKRTVVIVDCCFSGRAITAMSGPDSLLSGQLGLSGAYVLTSTTSNSTAVAPRNARHTTFTGSLIHTLREGIAQGPPFLRLKDIYEAIRKEMVISGNPQPMQMGTNAVSDLGLVRNSACLPINRHLNADNRTPGEMAEEKSEFAISGVRTMLISLVDYERFEALNQLDLSIAFIGLVDTSARKAGIDSSSWQRYPFSGGEFLAFPKNAASAERMIDMLTLLAADMAAYNHEQQTVKRMRLHVVIDDCRGLSDDRARHRNAAKNAANVLSRALTKGFPVPSSVEIAVMFSQTFWREGMQSKHASSLQGLEEVIIKTPNGEEKYHTWAM